MDDMIVPIVAECRVLRTFKYTEEIYTLSSRLGKSTLPHWENAVRQRLESLPRLSSAAATEPRYPSKDKRRLPYQIIDRCFVPVFTHNHQLLSPPTILARAGRTTKTCSLHSLSVSLTFEILKRPGQDLSTCSSQAFIHGIPHHDRRATRRKRKINISNAIRVAIRNLYFRLGTRDESRSSSNRPLSRQSSQTSPEAARRSFPSRSGDEERTASQTKRIIGSQGQFSSTHHTTSNF